MRLFSEQSSNISIRVLLVNAFWTLKQTWSAHALLTIGLIGSTLLQCLLPAGLVLIARGIINVVVEALKSGSNVFTPLLPWLGLGLVISLTEALSRAANDLFTHRLYDELNLKITPEILTHAGELDVSFFEDPRLQDILERARQNTADHFNQFLTNILAAVANIIQIASLVAILIFIEPLIALVLLPIGLPYLLFRWRFSKTRYWKEHSRASKRRWANYFTSLLTGQRSIPEIKLLNLAPLLTDKFKSLAKEFRDQDRRLYLHSFAGSSLFAVFSTTAFYATFAWVSLQTLKGALTVGDLAVYGGVTARLSRAIETTIHSVTNALEQTLYISNMIEFLRIQPSIANIPGIQPLHARGEITIENLSFTYAGSMTPALSDISLRIQAGETIALVGENGAGKTTLVKLIARLYDPDEGRILFDGIDLRELSLDYLQSHLSFVFQDFGRYEATAADNIAYGNWRQMMHDRERIEKMARLAGVDKTIEALPRGYDTPLGRMFGKHTLSDGQWQRIAVARSLARDGTVLILDEPTSNMDARAEYKLFAHFREIAEGRTTIIISHRFSTVSMADRILVMRTGRVIEEGTHQQLLDQAGHYADLYELHRRQMAFPERAP